MYFMRMFNMTNVNKIKPNEICHSLRVMDIKKHFISRLGIFFYIYKYLIFTINLSQ